MKKTLKTDDLYIEINKTEKGIIILNIYSNYDDDMFIETYLSGRELNALSNLLEEYKR